MTSTLIRVTFFTFAIFVWFAEVGHAQGKSASWLDNSKPVSWNKSGRPVPAAPRVRGAIDPRCRDLARPAERPEDKFLQGQGWDLVGAYQGGWRILVIQGSASYDGMCRPYQYQEFVFVRGVFAGTLSPQAMNSRTDGALSRVYLQNNSRLIAEYARYDATDPLCCPSRTTSVEFEIASDGSVVRSLSASTSLNKQ
jgi:hypothetical protein